MATWIFQGDPKVYDIANAIRSLREDTWLVTKHRQEIQRSDRVFLWQSGSKSGVVAIAEVLDEVSDRALPDESKRFVLDMKKLGGVKPRVRIRITKVVEPRLRRSEIKAHGGLDKLSIIRQAQGTNFKVTPQEAKILEGLIDA